MKMNKMITFVCTCFICSAVIVSVPAAMIPTQALESSESQQAMGDFDDNNTVDVSDAVAVLTFYARQSAGLSTDEFTYAQIKAADVDKDGVITVEDAVYILTYYARQSANLNPTWTDIVPQDQPFEDAAWKQAYYDLALSGQISDSYGEASYSLIYIDQDDIPELLVQYSYGGGALYTYNQGNCSLVHSWDSLRNSGFYGYIEKTGYFYTHSSSGAYVGATGKQEMTNGTFILRDSISMSDGVYQHNGVNCSYAEYTAIQEEYDNSCTPYSKLTFDELFDYISDERTLSEDEMVNILSSYGNVCTWEYADYDGDGTKEAFAVIGSDTSSGISDSIEGVYFIDSTGYVEAVRTSFYADLCSDATYTEYAGKGFFSCDITAGGSGWKTYLFSVKDGECYELNLSGSLQGFYNRNGICYTTESVFSAETGHEWVDVELIYDESTQEFSKSE